MHRLSNSSKAKYDTLHTDLQVVIDNALKYSPIDFGLSEGHRPPEKQFEYFKKGRKEVNGTWIIEDKSKVVTYKDGYEKKGKHNYSPSLAFDFFASVPGQNLTWDTNHLVALGSTFVALANKLYDEGKITHKLRWGGNFDMDGHILEPGSFRDSPHLELIG